MGAPGTGGEGLGQVGTAWDRWGLLGQVEGPGTGGGAWDREGNTTIMEFNGVSDKVDSSKFKVPSGYIDMTKFMGEDFAVLTGTDSTTKKK